MGKGSNPALRARGHAAHRPGGSGGTDRHADRRAVHTATGGGPRGSEATDADPPGAGGGRRRKLDLNVPQVAGSAAAAVVAAKFAANLGVYGTILGAGVVSAIATFSGSVFQHFFRRTGEQIRDAADLVRPRARQVPLPDTTGGRRVPETFLSHRAGVGDQAAPGPWDADAPVRAAGSVPGADATMALYAADPGHVAPHGHDGHASIGHDGRAFVPEQAAGPGPAAGPGQAAVSGLPPPGPAADPAALLSVPPPPSAPDALGDHPAHALSADATRLLPPHDDATRLMPLVRTGRRPRRTAAPGTGLPSDTFTEGTVHHARIRGVKRPLIAAGLVFAVTMGGITAYEAASGHSFTDGRTGTTIGDLFTSGGHSGSDHKPSTPASTPSQQPSDGSGQSDRQSGSGGTTTQSPQDGGQDQQSTPSPDPSSTSGDGTGSGTDSGSGGTTSPGYGDQQNPGSGTTPSPGDTSGTGSDSGSYTWQFDVSGG